ncbi:MAG: hypothetical protein JNN07_24815 [Verrucomicrobiales bacterium]|nr:hypothetical protein [Verrucomicrobiales bacterium]
MAQRLHLITQPQDSLAQEVVRQHLQAEGESQVRVIDLTAGTVDYAALVDAIFASDSVQVW